MPIKMNTRGNTKYGNTKVEYDGVKFDSKKEVRRYAELKLLVISTFPEAESMHSRRMIL